MHALGLVLRRMCWRELPYSNTAQRWVPGRVSVKETSSAVSVLLWVSECSALPIGGSSTSACWPPWNHRGPR